MQNRMKITVNEVNSNNENKTDSDGKEISERE